jgi:hypothetical protein
VAQSASDSLAFVATCAELQTVFTTFVRENSLVLRQVGLSRLLNSTVHLYLSGVIGCLKVIYMSNSVTILIGHLCLIGVWSGVDPKT